MNEKILRQVEECIENDPHLKNVREQVHHAVDASPSSVTFEQAESQVKKSMETNPEQLECDAYLISIGLQPLPF
jgi:hypothetical protein